MIGDGPSGRIVEVGDVGLPQAEGRIDPGARAVHPYVMGKHPDRYAGQAQRRPFDLARQHRMQAIGDVVDRAARDHDGPLAVDDHAKGLRPALHRNAGDLDRLRRVGHVDDVDLAAGADIGAFAGSLDVADQGELADQGDAAIVVRGLAGRDVALDSRLANVARAARGRRDARVTIRRRGEADSGEQQCDGESEGDGDLRGHDGGSSTAARWCRTRG